MPMVRGKIGDRTVNVLKDTGCSVYGEEGANCSDHCRHLTCLGKLTCSAFLMRSMT